MEIQRDIKRRYSEIDNYVNLLLGNYDKFGTKINKETFVNTISTYLSVWFVGTYLNHIDWREHSNLTNQYSGVFRYMFRTRISEHWDKINLK